MGYVVRDTYGVNEGLNSLFLCGVERINVHVKNLTVFKQKLLLVAKDDLDISNIRKKEALERLLESYEGDEERLVRDLEIEGDSLENYQEIIVDWNDEKVAQEAIDGWYNWWIMKMDHKDLSFFYSYD